MSSALYEGVVRHHRYRPRPHALSMRLMMPYLELGELPRLFRGYPGFSYEAPDVASFRRADHWGDPSVPLDETIRSLVAERTGARPAGPIRLLTHLRYLGYCMNPVCFFYCFDAADAAVAAVAAVVTNTPWGERHAYVLDARRAERAGPALRHRFQKAFHVSPFFPMDHTYDWRWTTPGRRLAVTMANEDASGRIFDAALVMRRRPLDRAGLRRLLWRYPAMTGQVIAAIYYHALRIRLKGNPFHPHPDRVAGGGA